MDQRSKEDYPKNNAPLSQVELQKLLNLIKTIRYGSVTVVIQDGQMVQIDKNEKIRLK